MLGAAGHCSQARTGRATRCSCSINLPAAPTRETHPTKALAKSPAAFPYQPGESRNTRAGEASNRSSIASVSDANRNKPTWAEPASPSTPVLSCSISTSPLFSSACAAIRMLCLAFLKIFQHAPHQVCPRSLARLIHAIQDGVMDHCLEICEQLFGNL